MIATKKKPYINDYMEERMTALNKEYGVFYAFGNDQFMKAKNPDLEVKDYISLGVGAYMPKGKEKEYINKSNELGDLCIEEIKADFTDKEIIRYTLGNYECFYTYDITDAMPTLRDFGYSEEQVWAVFKGK